MESDPGWGEERPLREGHVIYSAKNPRDPKGYENAKDDLERQRAYCFCPLVRNHMGQGMPIAFCYCGSGWYRQQWEGAIGRSVTVEIVKSILKGESVPVCHPTAGRSVMPTTESEADSAAPGA